MPKIIDKFNGEHRFLSNFFPSPIIGSQGISSFDREFPTIEHAYQAAKTTDPDEQEKIRLAATPGKAKRLGQKIKLRDNWETIKIEVMRELLEQKFSNEELKKQLLATGLAILVEENNWGDTFWGVCDGIGKNWLGRLLEERRSFLIMEELAKEAQELDMGY